MSTGNDSQSSADETLKALREALQLSPNSLALRQHLAETLLSHGRAAEAEKEFRAGLAQAPNSVPLKLGLARAFQEQNKPNHALVILEDVVQGQSAPARAFLLHAQLLAGMGEIEQSVAQYRRALELDATLADAEFEDRLGVGAAEDESEVVEG